MIGDALPATQVTDTWIKPSAQCVCITSYRGGERVHSGVLGKQKGLE